MNVLFNYYTKKTPFFTSVIIQKNSLVKIEIKKKSTGL